MPSSIRLPFITPSSGRFLVGLLLCVKLALLVWNAVVFEGKVYDQAHHEDRALFGGLRAGKLAYNPPLYYLPALLVKRPPEVPLVERSITGNSGGDDEEEAAVREAKKSPAGPAEVEHKAKQMKLLRYSNLFYASLTYIGWICFAFPRLLRGFGGWFLASLLMLSLPGLQKLAVMVHPDNAFAALVTLGVCAWLFVRDRFRASKLTFAHLIAFATITGSIGLTRPFSIAPVAVLTVALMAYLFRLEGRRWLRLVPRAAALLTIVGLLSGSWYVYRWQQSGQVTNAYRDRYIETFAKRRPGFDFVAYFSTLHVKELLESPNRKMAGGTSNIYDNNPHANSFFTLLYSEVWGDHWLYFSGKKGREGKLWPKRTVLTLALGTLPIAGLLTGGFVFDLVRRSRRALAKARGQRLGARLTQLVERVELDLVLLGVAGLGCLLYLYWQTGPALLPGKNSTIKFVYVASLVGPTLALLFRPRLQPLVFNLLAAYFLVLNFVALPVAMFWPS
jgi:hypothetical protein